MCCVWTCTMLVLGGNGVAVVLVLLKRQPQLTCIYSVLGCLTTKLVMEYCVVMCVYIWKGTNNILRSHKTILLVALYRMVRYRSKYLKITSATETCVHLHRLFCYGYFSIYVRIILSMTLPQFLAHDDHIPFDSPIPKKVCNVNGHNTIHQPDKV